MHAAALSRRSCRRALAPVAALAALAGLSGCGNTDPNAYAPTCAPVGILADAADYTLYKGDIPDIGQMISHGTITGIYGRCSNNKPGDRLQTTVSVEMDVTRGPAAPTNSVKVPFFVAVLKDGALLWKHDAEAIATFPSNVDHVHVRAAAIYLDLPVGRHLDGQNYRLEVGYQLTPAQLAYNRAHPPR
jgi:hypothetical protein